MYMIDTDAHGDRSFYYWRSGSPATRLLDSDLQAEKLLADLSQYSTCYFTGITVALYKDAARSRFLNLLKDYRAGGGKIIFDSNYRPALWADDDVQGCFQQVYKLTDLALPSIDDEFQVFGSSTPDAVINRLHKLGVEQVVLKMGDKGCIMSFDGLKKVIAPMKINALDTTAAGDSFNAGFIAASLSGSDPVSSAHASQRLAATVIQHRGAIIPLQAMHSIQDNRAQVT